MTTTMLDNRESVRLCILSILASCPAYTANQEIVAAALRQRGHALNRDQVKIELAWLASAARCIVDHVVEGIHVATLTAEGAEVLDNTRQVPGIDRPWPV